MGSILASFSSCTGCTSCASMCPVGCIEMKPDKRGFLHPEIDKERCVNCLQCKDACPIVTPLPLPGQRTIAYAGKSLDDDNRNHSSSGGIISELAKRIFQRGGVVWGAAYDETFSVKHTFAETMEQVAAFCGAKYAQGDLSGVFQCVKGQLESGISVLFSGLPCQTAGLLSFLGKQYENLICVDFVCHSVPSPLLWSCYKQYRSSVNGHGEPPISVNLRSKETGWSRYRYSVQFRFSQGAYSAISTDDPYMKLFISGCLSRESCSTCRFKGVDRLSDLTLGDCWGIWDFAPEFDDDKGISLILVHSSIGSEMVEELGESCSVRRIPMEAALARNPAISNPSKPHQKKNAVQELLLRNNDFGSAVDLLQKKTLLERAKNTAKRILK